MYTKMNRHLTFELVGHAYYDKLDVNVLVSEFLIFMIIIIVKTMFYKEILIHVLQFDITMYILLVLRIKSVFSIAVMLLKINGERS